MRTALLRTPDDLQWLAEVHGVDVTDVTVAAIIGNEDCPTEVRTYTFDNVTQRPVVYLRNGAGDLVRQPPDLSVTCKTCFRPALSKPPGDSWPCGEPQCGRCIGSALAEAEPLTPAPECGHSACRQNWIDTGDADCVVAP